MTKLPNSYYVVTLVSHGKDFYIQVHDVIKKIKVRQAKIYNDHEVSRVLKGKICIVITVVNYSTFKTVQRLHVVIRLRMYIFKCFVFTWVSHEIIKILYVVISSEFRQIFGIHIFLSIYIFCCIAIQNGSGLRPRIIGLVTESTILMATNSRKLKNVSLETMKPMIIYQGRTPKYPKVAILANNQGTRFK